MANKTVTPNMGLILPIPGQDPGPDWAQNQYASGFILDQHNHSSGQGVQITPAGLNINAQLAINGNNLNLPASIQFTNLTNQLAGSAPFLNTAYAFGGNLWFNDSAGNQVQITKSGSVNATSSGISSGTASASFSGGVLVVDQNTNTPGNIQAGSILIGNNTAGSNFVTLQPVSSLAASYSLTLPRVPASTSVLGIDSSGNIGAVTTTVASAGANAIFQSRTMTTGSTVGIGGFAISASSGAFSTTGTAFVTNLSVTITTSGRPVRVALQNDGTGNPGLLGTSWVETSAFNSDQQAEYVIFNGSTPISTEYLGGHDAGSATSFDYHPTSSISAVDTTVNGSPGTYTYTFRAQAIPSATGTTTAYCEFAVLTAYEI